jgi:2-polyprenyl-3-methyl-5-hydroxy-6-metoxy-1,4-benzoquinol methylase
MEPMSSAIQPCPLTGGHGKVLFDLDRRKIIECLEKYFGRAFPGQIPVCDYRIVEGAWSGLVYASPLTPAPGEFYAWCALDPSYYPADRLEWGQAAEIILGVPGANTSDSKILDVGCGDGRALAFLRQSYRGTLEGVDLSAESAKACLNRGFRVFSGDFVELMNLGVLGEKSYDWVLSFHCLEHVSNPLGFVKQMVRLLKPSGSLLISTPLSPMSFESDYFDIMNFPPHHMTRWSIKAYETLATILGLELKIHLPEARPWCRRALNSFKLKTVGRTTRRLGITQYFKLALSSLNLIPIMRRQLWVRLPDVILVQLRRK